MTIGQYLGLKPRTGKVKNSDRAKIRHNNGILVAAGKPKYLIAKVLAGQYRISLSTYYRIIR